MERTDSLAERFDGHDPVRVYLGTLVALVVAVAGGIVAFPERFYEGFIWQYFWGPVVADAHGAQCATMQGGEWEIPQNCAAAAGTVAYPGYTLVSTASYAVLLLFALLGVYLLLERLGLANDVSLLYPLFPFVLFGGALRTAEDANALLLVEAGSAPIPFPWSALIISPFIYVTVFAVTMVAGVSMVLADDRGYVDDYRKPLAAIGAVLLAVPVVWLGYLSATREDVGFNPEVAVITLGGATILMVLAWVLSERYAPEVNAGTGYMGALIVWGHAVDGVANVLSLDWADTFGLPGYAPKHVANAAIQDATAAIQGWVHAILVSLTGWEIPSINEAIGYTWPFIPVKVGVALLAVWIFNEEVIEDSPTYSLLLLIAILAVGLGPGTRDMLRATFGI